MAEIGAMHQTFNLGSDKVYVGSSPTGVTRLDRLEFSKTYLMKCSVENSTADIEQLVARRIVAPVLNRRGGSNPSGGTSYCFTFKN